MGSVATEIKALAAALTCPPANAATIADAIKAITDLYTNREIVDAARFYPSIKNETVNIIAPYSASHNARYVWKRKGPNSLFDLDKIFFINAGDILSNDITAGTKFWENPTECLSPYSVRTIVEGGGDTDWIFTGGNHGFNGDQTGAPTARCESIAFVVDGKAVDEFSGYCSSFTAKWTNVVKAMNTVLEDGTGRDVVSEEYTMNFDGVRFGFNNLITVLEQCTIYRYFGLSLILSNWDAEAWKDQILFLSSADASWKNATENLKSGDKKATEIIARNEPHYASLGIAPYEGLGDGRYITNSETTWNAHYDFAVNKVYFDLIDGSGTFEEGQVLSYSGSMKFYGV